MLVAEGGTPFVWLPGSSGMATVCDGTLGYIKLSWSGQQGLSHKADGPDVLGQQNKNQPESAPQYYFKYGR